MQRNFYKKKSHLVDVHLYDTTEWYREQDDDLASKVTGDSEE